MFGGMVGLNREHIPIDPKPAQVVEERIGKFRPTARGIDILDPQHEAPIALSCKVMRENRRKRVSDMQPPRRRRSESCNYRLTGLSHESALDRESRVVLSCGCHGSG